MNLYQKAMLQLRQLAKRLFYLLTDKNIDVKRLAEETIVIKQRDIEYFPLSSNLIMIIHQGEKILYFRECPLHSNLPTYMNRAFNLFYIFAKQDSNTFHNFKQSVSIATSFSDEKVDSLKTYISSRLSNAKFIEKLLLVPMVMERDGYNIFKGSKILPKDYMADIGLIDFPDDLSDMLPLLLVYLRGVVTMYLKHKHLSHKKYETYNAARSLGTYQFAKLFGVEKLIVETKLAKLIVDDKELYGVVCESAPGIRALDSEIRLSPAHHADLTSLNILDALCFQKDHYPNNYNISKNSKTDRLICAFDNDNDTTFMPAFSLNMKNLISPVVKGNKLNRPFVEEQLIFKIESLNYKDVWRVMSNYLNSFQLLSLIYRVSLLKKAIMHTKKTKSSKFIGRKNWTQDYMDEEIKGDYGETYTTLYNRKNILK